MISVGMASRPAVSKREWLSRMLGRLAPPVPIGFVTEVTNVTPASAGGSGPATLATPAPLWPRERPNSRQNGHERTAGVAKETAAWPRRRRRGQRDGGVAKEYPVPNVTSWTGRIVAMRGAPPVPVTAAPALGRPVYPLNYTPPSLAPETLRDHGGRAVSRS